MGVTWAPSGRAARLRSATTLSAFCLRDRRSCCCSSHSLRCRPDMPAVGSTTSAQQQALSLGQLPLLWQALHDTACVGRPDLPAVGPASAQLQGFSRT